MSPDKTPAPPKFASGKDMSDFSLDEVFARSSKPQPAPTRTAAATDPAVDGMPQPAPRPRTARSRHVTASESPTPTPVPPQPQVSQPEAPASPRASRAGKAHPVSAGSPSQARARRGRPPKTRTNQTVTRGSNALLPIDMIDKITDLCARQGISHGRAVQMAVEGVVPTLKQRLTITRASKALFQPLGAEPQRDADVRTANFSFRLRGSDFDVLEQLCADYQIPTRTALLAAAFEHFLEENA